ncbi:DUF397 domain-containing protein [Actinomadura xylanilytica]|uniref:DUF397 domain-containing protein n=1 Tax=Actinomadura xylanilytica TaxID=887459 RepID=UPI00255A7654|nr:DUF397 domain-containing protein [Actinomadura xylanilytica]MDL4777468.1 DUF397 domain-containing protein [Actinomadura xylanilytica]
MTPHVPAGPRPWRKSSHSGDKADCVEVARLGGGGVGLRDSKDPGGPVLVLSPRAWTALARILD